MCVVYILTMVDLGLDETAQEFVFYETIILPRYIHDMTCSLFVLQPVSKIFNTSFIHDSNSYRVVAVFGKRGWPT